MNSHAALIVFKSVRENLLVGIRDAAELILAPVGKIPDKLAVLFPVSADITGLHALYCLELFERDFLACIFCEGALEKITDNNIFSHVLGIDRYRRGKI